MRHVRSTCLLGAYLVACLLGVGAAGAGCGPTSSTDPNSKAVIIGQNGGQAASVSGALKLQVPSGALETSVAITISEVDAPGSGSIGQTFELGPSGTRFKTPATVVFRFKAADVGGRSPSDLRVATYSRGAWYPVSSNINASAGLVSAQISHFSPWSLVMVGEVQTTADFDAGINVTGSGGDPGTGTGGSGGEGGASGIATSGGAGGASGASGAGGAGGEPDGDAGADPDAV